MTIENYTYNEKNEWTRQKSDPKKFSGMIYDCDFEIGVPTKNRRSASLYARRIMACRAFDYLCKKNGEYERAARARKKQFELINRKDDVLF